MELKNVDVDLPTGNPPKIQMWVRGQMTPEIDATLNSVPFDILTVGGNHILKCLGPYASKIRHVSLLSTDSYEGLENLFALERLGWRDATKNTFDFRRLPKLSHLTNEWAGMTPLPFFNIPSLEKLGLWGVKAKDLTFLSNCQRLRVLCLRRGSTNSLAGLPNLTAIRMLGLFQLRTLNDLSLLSNAIGLEFLHLANMSQLEDISPIYNLKNLRYLMLANLPKAKQKNVDWLSKLPLLQCAQIPLETDH